MLMLEHKGISWRTVELPAGFQPFVLRTRGFSGRTVPALKLDGIRVQTNRRIVRFLDRLQPKPPLLPRERRAETEDAERFADEVVQPLARRLALAAGRRDLSLLAGHGEAGRLGAILAQRRAQRARVIRLAAWYFGITDDTEALDRAALPGVLDQVDALVEAKVLNGKELNAADFQIAPTLCLLAYRLDLREAVEARPAWRLVDRLIPAPAEVR
jgi:glutathione S-transferase